MKDFLSNGTLALDDFWEITFFSLLVLIIAIVFARIVRFVIARIIRKRIGKNKSDYSTTSLKFLLNSISFFSVIVALVAIVLTVPLLRSKATFIFSGAGILAAIIGFAAQAAISNLIAGGFIVIFKPFRVGDFIRLDDTRVGIVEDITLRHTVINNFENKRLIIPNSIISTESVLNHTIEDFKVLSFNNFWIDSYADIDLARKIIQEEARELQFTIDNPGSRISKNKDMVDVRMISAQNFSIHLRAYIWINEPFEEFKNRAELTERVHKRFIEEGVSLPIRRQKIIQ